MEPIFRHVVSYQDHPSITTAGGTAVLKDTAAPHATVNPRTSLPGETRPLSALRGINERLQDFIANSLKHDEIVRTA